jgi:hypothetical protein
MKQFLLAMDLVTRAGLLVWRSAAENPLSLFVTFILALIANAGVLLRLNHSDISLLFPDLPSDFARSMVGIAAGAVLVPLCYGPFVITLSRQGLDPVADIEPAPLINRFAGYIGVAVIKALIVCFAILGVFVALSVTSSPVFTGIAATALFVCVLLALVRLIGAPALAAYGYRVVDSLEASLLYTDRTILRLFMAIEIVDLPFRILRNLIASSDSIAFQPEIFLFEFIPLVLIAAIGAITASDAIQPDQTSVYIIDMD